MFKNFFSVIYVHILKDEFLLFHLQKETSLHVMADLPFSSQRLAIGDFTIAEKLLSTALKKLMDRKGLTLLVTPSPIVIMHPKYLCEGGLSQVEERVIKELALSSGAMKVYIWQGADLTPEQLLNEVYK